MHFFGYVQDVTMAPATSRMRVFQSPAKLRRILEGRRKRRQQQQTSKGNVSPQGPQGCALKRRFEKAWIVSSPEDRAERERIRSALQMHDRDRLTRHVRLSLARLQRLEMEAIRKELEDAMETFIGLCTLCDGCTARIRTKVPRASVAVLTEFVHRIQKCVGETCKHV